MEPSYSTTGKLSNHQSTLPPQASHRGVTAESRPSGKQRDEREAVEPPVHAATRQPSHASHPPQQRDAESRPSGKPSHHQSTPPHRAARNGRVCGRGGCVGGSLGGFRRSTSPRCSLQNGGERRGTSRVERGAAAVSRDRGPRALMTLGTSHRGPPGLSDQQSTLPHRTAWGSGGRGGAHGQRGKGGGGDGGWDGGGRCGEGGREREGES